MEDWLRYCVLAAQVVCAVRVVWVGAGKYPALLGFLIFNVVAAVFSVGAESIRLFVATSVVDLALQLAMLLEIHSRLVDDFPGLRRLGTILTQTTVWATGACVVAITFVVPAERLSRLSRMIPFQLGNVHWAFATVAATLIGLVVVFGLRPPRNVRTYMGFVFVLFLSSATMLTIMYQAGPETWPLLLATRYGVAALTLVAMSILFSPAGETLRLDRSEAHRQEQKSPGDLQTVNQSLIGAIRDEDG